MAALGEFLSVFGELGLVFTILMSVIFFLGKAYIRERKKREEAEKKFQDFLLTNIQESTETTLGFSHALAILKEKLIAIDTKIK